LDWSKVKGEELILINWTFIQYDLKGSASSTLVSSIGGVPNSSVGDDSDEYSFIHSSMISTRQHESLMDKFFMNMDKMNSIFSSPTSKVSFPLFTSIIAPTIAKNNLPKKITMLGPSPQS